MFKRLRMLVVCCVASILTGVVCAIEMGSIKVFSGVSEPLEARIELINPGILDNDLLIVDLASKVDYLRYYIKRHYYHADIETSLESDESGAPFIRLYSREPITTKTMDLLVMALDQEGKHYGKYRFVLPDSWSKKGGVTASNQLSKAASRKGKRQHLTQNSYPFVSKKKKHPLKLTKSSPVIPRLPDLNAMGKSRSTGLIVSNKRQPAKYKSGSRVSLRGYSSAKSASIIKPSSVVGRSSSLIHSSRRSGSIVKPVAALSRSSSHLLNQRAVSSGFLSSKAVQDADIKGHTSKVPSFPPLPSKAAGLYDVVKQKSNAMGVPVCMPGEVVVYQREKHPDIPSSNRYYQVKAGDTLSRVAIRLKRSDSSYPSWQVLVEYLQQLNPDALIDGDMNRLKLGSLLLLPDIVSGKNMVSSNASGVFDRQPADKKASSKKVFPFLAKEHFPVRKAVKPMKKRQAIQQKSVILASNQQMVVDGKAPAVANGIQQNSEEARKNKRINYLKWLIKDTEELYNKAKEKQIKNDEVKISDKKEKRQKNYNKKETIKSQMTFTKNKAKNIKDVAAASGVDKTVDNKAAGKHRNRYEPVFESRQQSENKRPFLFPLSEPVFAPEP